MGFFKKIVKKVKKSAKRISHGKFHLSSGLWNKKLDWKRKLLPKSIRKNVTRSWGDLKRSHRFHFDRLFGGNNSALSFSSSSPYTGVGYQYRGKSISELM